MIVTHFPPIFENLQEWWMDIFLLFYKICRNDFQTFFSIPRPKSPSKISTQQIGSFSSLAYFSSSYFFKVAIMTKGQLPPFFWKIVRLYIGHFPPYAGIFEKSQELPNDNFLLFLKNCQNDYWTFSTNFWKIVWMTIEHFPPNFESLPEWWADKFLLILKICKNDAWTFSSCFWKIARMTIRHFPPVYENLPEW